jgi:uncharacterized repeat protein (TIGR03803 family)
MKSRVLSSFFCGVSAFAVLMFTISPAAWAAAKETRIHEFDGSADPIGLAADSAGNLYGTTGNDGFHSFGTVFEARLSAYNIWTETTIYSFTGGSDGGAPESALTVDAHGNLYGTTQLGGGACNCGTVFELSKAANGEWTETTLYTFAGGAYGSSPEYTNLVFDAAGNIYGVTTYGGSDLAGTVFELSPQAGGGWAESILHTFTGGASDGANPFGGLVFDKAGNLYGSAETGGSSKCGGGGCGGIFELSPLAGGGWQEQMIYFFQGGNDGDEPDSLLVTDLEGNLYGMAQGGSNNCGSVFKLSPSAGGGWSKKILHAFSSEPDGCGPFLNLVHNSGGYLFGITEGGGSTGNGAIFQISPGGVEQVFFSFPGGNSGADPRSLILGPKGPAFFGVTFGLYGNLGGLLFEVSN